MTDCSVIAIAALADVSYHTAHHACDSQGRPAFDGLNVGGIVAALGSLDQRVVALRFQSRTARTVAREFPKGRYLIVYNDHVSAMIDGVIQDWAAGTLKRVQMVFEVMDVSDEEE